MPFSGFEVDFWLDNLGKSSTNSYSILECYGYQRLYDFNIGSSRLVTSNFFIYLFLIKMNF